MNLREAHSSVAAATVAVETTVALRVVLPPLVLVAKVVDELIGSAGLPCCGKVAWACLISATSEATSSTRPHILFVLAEVRVSLLVLRHVAVSFSDSVRCSPTCVGSTTSLATSILVREVSWLLISLGIVPSPIVAAWNLATHVVVIRRGTLPVVTLIATLGRPSPVLLFELGRWRVRSSLVALVSAATLRSRVDNRTLFR